MQQKPQKKTHDVVETTMSKEIYQAMELGEKENRLQYIEQNAKVAKTSEEDPRIEMRSTSENNSESSDE